MYECSKIRVQTDSTLKKIFSFKVLSIFMELCRALEYIDRNDYVYRDIKLENILVSDQKIAKRQPITVRESEFLGGGNEKTIEFPIIHLTPGFLCIKEDPIIDIKSMGSPPEISEKVNEGKSYSDYNNKKTSYDVFGLGMLFIEIILYITINTKNSI